VSVTPTPAQQAGLLAVVALLAVLVLRQVAC